MSFRTFQNKIQRGQVASLGLLLAAISTLLLAAPAGAETLEASPLPVSAPPATAEAASAAPIVPTETNALPPEPVETEQAVSEVDSAIADSTAEVVRSLPPTANSVSSTVTKVEAAIAGTEPDTAVIPTPRPRVSQLVDQLGRSAAQATGAIRRDAAELIAPATETDPSGPSTTAGEGQSWATPGFPALPPTGFSPRGAIVAELFMAGQLADLDRLGTEDPQALSRAGERGSRLPATDLSNAAFNHSDAARHLDSPAPVDVPLPAPGSPATSSSGPGGSSFVPLAALLALLALVPPATLRRLGRSAGFRAPTLFVCALERPG